VIDGAVYNLSTEFYLNDIFTMPYPSNYILIWGSVLLHRLLCLADRTKSCAYDTVCRLSDCNTYIVAKR